jgi:hypothetical protein
MTTPPNIPVSPASRTSPLKVELSPDGQAVRIGALLDGRTVVVGRRNTVIHDLDPAEALWLSTLIRAHAETVIVEQVIADRRDAAPKEES